MATAFRHDYFIERRRDNENKLRDVYNYINENKISTQNVLWEDKNQKANEKRKLQKQLKNYQDQSEKFLDLRRKKLSELLNKEEYDYHVELITTQENPEVVRKRMEAQLKQLKSTRESDRDTNVAKLKEKLFYDSTDELRKNDSEAFAYECYLEQENQMLDKLKRREKEKKEEMFYVKLNEFDNLKKIEKEKEEEKVKKAKIKNIYDYQQWQREQNELQVRHANEINELENKRLKDQWKMDDEKELENEKKRKLANIQVYRDIENFNQKEDEERKKKTEFEKIKDKELIDSIVANEKALDLLDKQEKEKKVKEFYQNKKYLEYVMNQKKEAEIWMDKIAQDEADKEYKKEQEEWAKEDAKRIELLKDVYKGREQALIYKKKIQEDEKNNIAKERKEVDQKIKEYYEEVKKVADIEAKKRKNHQSELIYQISEKQDLRKKELQDKLYEERAAKLWEMEYKKKIDEKKALHLQRLKEIKERNNFNS